MTQLDAALVQRAKAWAEKDPDPATAAELTAMIEAATSEGAAGSGVAEAAAASESAAVSTEPGEGAAASSDMAAAARAEIADAFSGPLQFGTAGLRAALGPGPNRMNQLVVRRAAAGLAKHLNVAAAEGGYTARAVVGFDARRKSDVFARESAASFTAAGIQTFLMPAALPTPLLAFAVRALGCEAGVMVTASHNPAQDNGYKVYLGGKLTDDAGRGSQIVPPADAQIADAIAQVTAADESGERIQLAEVGWQEVPAEIIAAYRQGLVERLSSASHPSRELKIVLTAMHGVGGETAVSVLNAGGFTDVHPVTVQQQPDPAFPTVAFPNPEEPGAMDLALATAAEVGADLVLANDPDADRVAVAAVDPASGDWRVLRGDESGALLGLHIASLTEPGEGKVFATSIVSSRLLGKIAANAGFAAATTLTGFKWISRVPGLVYGYEEALGYCVAPSLVRDKDGISAGLLIAELAASLKAQGRTLFDLLDQAYSAYGVHASDQLSIRVSELSARETMLSRLRNQPPSTLDGAPVTEVSDLAAGYQGLPPTEGLLLLAEDDTRVIVRPSGTEPKLKCYLEVIEPVGASSESTGSPLATAKKAAAQRLARVKESLAAMLQG